jgi:hypothetical protein
MAKVCPDCGSTRVHRSRSTSVAEKLQKNMTTRRLFRCHDCGWRGWLDTQRHRSAMKKAPRMGTVWLLIILAAGVVMGFAILLGKLW